MAEYIIKVDEDKKDIMGNCPLVEKPQELVRCKDCKHWKRRECGSYGTCENENMGIVGFFDADWFCPDGKRREE